MKDDVEPLAVPVVGATVGCFLFYFIFLASAALFESHFPLVSGYHPRHGRFQSGRSERTQTARTPAPPKAPEPWSV